MPSRLIVFISIMLVAMTVACTPAPTPIPPIPTQTAIPPTPTLNQVPRISVADANQLLGKDSVVFVDVRPLPQYTSSHIKGAISVSFIEVESRLKELPRDKDLILYCS